MTRAWAYASMTALLLAAASPAHAQSQPVPKPGRWGAADQAGSSNTQTPAKALQAAKLVTAGKTYPLAHPYEDAMPKFANRVFALTGTGGVAGGPLGDNGAFYNDDFLATQIGQVGTQFDALGHVGMMRDGKEIYYGGRTGDQVHGPAGLRQLGAEQIKPFFTRGLLVDIEGYKGRVLPAGTPITIADLEGALRKQGLDPESIGEGDVVLIHTGWGRYWKTDNKTFTTSSPGIDLAAARWLAKKGVAIIGSDTMVVEVSPNPDPAQAMPVHVEMMAINGIYLLECVATEALRADAAWEFAFSYAPMAIVGATGAPGTALAIR